MVMPTCFVDDEHDRDLGKEWAVPAGVEAQPIGAGQQLAGKESAQPAVGIGFALPQLAPALSLADLQLDRHSRGGSALRGVEHVGGDAHAPPSHLSMRNRRIFACSSAAVRISRARGSARRSFNDASISSALRPAAQMRKTKPCFSKYSPLRRASCA